MWKISAVIIACVSFLVLPQGGIYPKIPGLELSTAPGPFSALGPIPAFGPIAAPGPIAALVPLPETIAERGPIPTPEAIPAPVPSPVPETIAAAGPIPTPEAITALVTLPVPETIATPERIPAPVPLPVPVSETIAAPGPIPTPETALQPIQDPERIVAGTCARTKKAEYAVSRAFQRRTSQEREYFWMLLGGPLFLSLITLTACVTVWCHLRRVSYREHERTQKPAQSKMSVHQWECVQLEMRDVLAKVQKSVELRAQVQKELHTSSLMVKERDEKLVQLRNELDKITMIVKAQRECCNQLVSDSTRTAEMEEEEQPPHIQEPGLSPSDPTQRDL
ncbi:uncharacterized protein LOC117282113 [Cryptotermes secundus]|uniref:uncharacterized protein LOC117282113 n=1 Tax=Cryptotermes secundus TaxID=105785 RepID=UPI001454DEF7|nr:uncharacterized protein LOC117282113 [Cryptotermes secundus]